MSGVLLAWLGLLVPAVASAAVPLAVCPDSPRAAPLASGPELAFHDVPGSTYNECVFLLLQLEDDTVVFVSFLGTQVPATRRKVGVEISLCHPDREPVFLKSEYPWESRRESPGGRGIRIGDSRLSLIEGGYELLLSEDRLLLEARLLTSLPVTRPGGGRVWFGEDRELFYDVRVLFPRARVAGRLVLDGVERPIRGWAYADHSYQNILGSKLSDRWYSLRFHGPERSLAFVAYRTPPRYGARLVSYLLVATDDAVEVLSTTARIREHDPRPDPAAGYQVPRRFTLEAAGDAYRLEGDYSVSRRLERLDVLSHLGFLQRNLVKAFFARPVFYRFTATVNLHLTLDESPIPLQGPGVLEYICVN